MIKTGAYKGKSCAVCGCEETLPLPEGKVKCLNPECDKIT